MYTEKPHNNDVISICNWDWHRDPCDVGTLQIGILVFGPALEPSVLHRYRDGLILIFPMRRVFPCQTIATTLVVTVVLVTRSCTS